MNFMVRNGYFGYSRSKQILQNVNLGVDDGQVLCILGPNGVGKTTLLRCMMGMLPWQSGRPTWMARNYPCIQSGKSGNGLPTCPRREAFPLPLLPWNW